MSTTRVLSQEEIGEVLTRCGLTWNPLLLERAEAYLVFLEKWSARINLTAMRDPLGVLEVLLAESFFGAQFVGNPAGPVLDIGSGAGFPGLAIAAYRSELDVILLEPRQRRAAFLTAMRRKLGLPNVTVWSRRVEECSPSDFPVLPGVLTMRAVGLSRRVVVPAFRLLGGAGRIVLFSSAQAAKGTMEKVPVVRWQRPIAVPWNPAHVVLVGEI